MYIVCVYRSLGDIRNHEETEQIKGLKETLNSTREDLK